MDDGHAPSKTEFTKLTIVVFVNITLALLAYRFLFPNAFAADAAQPGMTIVWILALGVPFSLFEYMYHRYLLHSAVVPFLGRMNQAHREHHGLTPVKAPITPREPELMVEVDNRYPIEHEHQQESMMFPPFALAIFYAIFALLFGWPLHAIFPGQPIFLALIISTTLYYSAYEYWHAVLHLPYDKFWKRYIEGPKPSRIVRRIYAFHLMHHWRPTSNVAVVGLWGFAAWDYAFGTHHRPVNLPVKGATVNFLDGELPRPYWPIRILDRIQGPLFRAARTTERFLARMFGIKSKA